MDLITIKVMVVILEQIVMEDIKALIVEVMDKSKVVDQVIVIQITQVDWVYMEITLMVNLLWINIKLMQIKK
jgi:hypothetical protein